MDRKLKDEVVNLLDGLGIDADEVAQTLANKGVKGQVAHPDLCPLAVLLMEQFPLQSVLVLPGQVWMKQAGEVAILHKTGAAVSDFISAFDSGAYPDLVHDELEVVDG